MMNESQWEKVKQYLPKYPYPLHGGRPRVNLRIVFEGILYKMQSNAWWKNVPNQFGGGTTLNDYFREWEFLGVFKRLEQAGILDKRTWSIRNLS